jgi:hypothetical protein
MRGLFVSVIGCNHGIQIEPAGLLAKLNSADAQEQRQHFGHLLEAVLSGGEVEFVGEEWGAGEKTIAEVLASRFRIPYADINPPNAVRDRVGMPRDYLAGPYTHEQRERWHKQRERLMLERIRECCGPARNLLVVCGFTHMEGLASLLRGEGSTVETADYRAQPWYQRGVFPDCA